MFCHNCGKQLPEGTKHCDGCGAMINQPPQKPVDPKAETPANHRKNNGPVQPERKPKPVQPEIITAPVQSQDRYVPIRPEIEPIPVQQEIKPTPVQCEIQTAPMERVVNDRPAVLNDEPKSSETPKKRIRKLPILLAVIAAIVVLLIAGGKEEEPEIIVDRNKPRYDSEKFLLTHEEFEAIYTELLEENGISIKKKGEVVVGEYYTRRETIYDRKQEFNFGTHFDPDTGKVEYLFATFLFDEDEVVDLDETQLDVMYLLYEAAHGPIEKDFETLFSTEPLIEGDYEKYMQHRMDGLIFECAVGDAHITARAKIDTEEEPESEAEIQLQETEPEATEASKQEPAENPQKFGTSVPTQGEDGQRFDGNGFKFDLDELRANYSKILEEIDSPFVVGGLSNYDKKDHDVYLSLKNNVGANVVDVQVVRDIATNRITKVFAYQRWMEKGYEPVTTEEIIACLYIIPACYGPMTDEEWDIVQERISKIGDDEDAFFEVKMNGMSVWFNIQREEQHFSVGCTIED